MATASAARSLVEVRLLDGPNLYFPRPAAKVTLDLTELLGLPRPRPAISEPSWAWARRVPGQPARCSGSVSRYGW